MFVGDTTADRQAAADLIEICDAWMLHQPRKRQTLDIFQILCLSLIAKRANCVKLKLDWINAGDLVRLAFASGMHRDPTLLATGRISAYEMEMKKRIWATTMELELQSSVDAGMQSSLAGLYFDSPSPNNIDDDTFSIATLTIPTAALSGSFTPTSFLVISRKSLSLRIQLTQLLNHPTSNLQYSDILHYDTQIHAAIASLPKWDERCSKIPTALLRLQLQQYLLLLHKPYANLALKDQRYMYSFTTIINVAESVNIEYQSLLSAGILALHHFRNDVLRVGLTLSRVIYENCDHIEVQSIPPVPGSLETPFKDSETHFADTVTYKHGTRSDAPMYLAGLPTESVITRTLLITSLELLGITRQLYEQKVMRLGTGYMEFWLLSAATGMLPPVPLFSTSEAYAAQPTGDILSRCRTSLDSFMTLISRVLALQQDPQAIFASSLRENMVSLSPSDARTPSVNLNFIANTGAISESLDPLSSSVADSGPSTVPEEVSKDLDGTFDILQDMQVDLGDWLYPDFWAFDVGDY
ncbi:hypothetical protein NX059_007606 [Plenodomus lindquistii]|nr:hypothetical protein NX059_007606 [Plenodomus lindquistii]